MLNPLVTNDRLGKKFAAEQAAAAEARTRLEKVKPSEQGLVFIFTPESSDATRSAFLDTSSKAVAKLSQGIDGETMAPTFVVATNIDSNGTANGSVRLIAGDGHAQTEGFIEKQTLLERFLDSETPQEPFIVFFCFDRGIEPLQIAAVKTKMRILAVQYGHYIREMITL